MAHRKHSCDMMMWFAFLYFGVAVLRIKLIRLVDSTTNWKLQVESYVPFGTI